MHYGLEFGLVCSGNERRFFFDKSERDVTAGDIWFCGMWEPHGASVIKAPCEVIVLLVWPPLLAQAHFPDAPDFYPLAPFNAPPKQRPRTPEKMKATMIGFIRRFKNILSAGVSHQTIRLKFVLQELLLVVSEFWPEAAVWGSRAPSADFSKINQALKMVFSSCTFISTTEAARACGMDRHTFSDLFRSWMNIGFADFSIKHRLHQAAGQLRGSQEPIKAIARFYGFADASHFHRVFLKHFSISAAEYRNQAQVSQNSVVPRKGCGASLNPCPGTSGSAASL